MKTIQSMVVAVLCTGLTVVTGCGGGGGSGNGNGNGEVSELGGRVEIDGSSTVYPISEAVATAFREPFPNVKVTVAISGTGGGFKRFTQGETDISDASRPIKKGEFDLCVESKTEFLELPVAYDGLTIVVNPQNDWVQTLTVDQLKHIFRAESPAKTWADLDGSWPAEDIKIYAPGTDSGTFDYFKEVVAKEGSIRADMSTSEDDHILVTGVAGEKYAVGFFGAAYYFENKDKLKAVPIVNPETDTPVAPSAETIESGDYAPFSRPLFIYVNVTSLKRPEVKKFVEYYLDHAAEMAAKAQYVGLPEELYTRVREHYDNRHTGTHFMTADGDKRSGALADVYVTENLVSK